jgi:hypothetical protein
VLALLEAPELLVLFGTKGKVLAFACHTAS